jgi:hypothetical protein
MPTLFPEVMEKVAAKKWFSGKVSLRPTAAPAMGGVIRRLKRSVGSAKRRVRKTPRSTIRSAPGALSKAVQRRKGLALIFKREKRSPLDLIR